MVSLADAQIAGSRSQGIDNNLRSNSYGQAAFMQISYLLGPDYMSRAGPVNAITRKISARLAGIPALQ